MKILFSPSESKSDYSDSPPFSPKEFLFPELYERREEVLERYAHFIFSCDEVALQKLFGFSSMQEVLHYKRDIFKEPTLMAIERYNGVAYDHLDFSHLDASAQKYLLENTLIFSNLFGPILAKDKIPNYRLQQGQSFLSFDIPKHYKKYFSEALEEFCEGEVIDLRAGFYDKFFVPKCTTLKMKFLNEGKVVSHFAKVFRGKVLKEIGLRKPKSIKDFMEMEIEGLHLKEMQTRKNERLLVLEAT